MPKLIIYIAQSIQKQHCCISYFCSNPIIKDLDVDVGFVLKYESNKIKVLKQMSRRTSGQQPDLRLFGFCGVFDNTSLSPSRYLIVNLFPCARVAFVCVDGTVLVPLCDMKAKIRAD